MRRLACATASSLVAIGSFLSAASLAGPPSVEEVLRICRENREKLNPLFVQATHTEERTDAFAKSQQKNAIGLEAILKSLDKGESIPDLDKQMPGVSLSQFKEILREQLESAHALARSVRLEHTYEFVIDGGNYQVRSAAHSVEKGWRIPSAVLTADALTKEFAQTRIYSRCAERSPPAQIWPGQQSADSDTYAMITAKHIGETQNMRFPAGMQAMHPQVHYVHPIDLFFAAPADRYRVVGQERKDGRLLTIVDVLVPTEQKGSKIGRDGKPQAYNRAWWFRAWLDLDRGGIPVVLHFWYGVEGEAFEERFRSTPSRVTTTKQIKRLANGAYYPTQTVEEHFSLDPEAPALTEAQWAEVRAGSRKAPPNAVFERYTWFCFAVEARPAGDKDFFVLRFPEGQKFFNLDTGKVVGALEKRPAIKAGEAAPGWKVARWLDGKQHRLEELRGKVVVLHFWGMWCGACRNCVPAVVALEQKFKDKPVVFVSIHTADHHGEKLAARMEKFALKQGWGGLAAIDAGTMTENSATSHAYGCDGFPTFLVIGPDGRVCYNSAVPEPGLEGIVGKRCDEITAEDQVKIDAHQKVQFEAAGEKWPLAKDISPRDLSAVANRVFVFHLSRRIGEVLGRIED